MKYWRRQNIALTKYNHWQNISIDKKFALLKYWCRRNIVVHKILVSTNYKPKQIIYKSSEESSYCFGLAKSTVAGSSLTSLVFSTEDVVSSSCSHWVTGYSLPADLYGQTSSAMSRPCCTGPPCQKVTKYWCQQKNLRLPKFHRFSTTFSSQYLCSEVSYRKMVNAKDAHYNCPISVFLHLTFIWRPSRRSYAAFGNCSNWRWVGGGGEKGGLSAVPPAPDLIGRTHEEGGGTPRCMLHLHHLEPWISLRRPLFACFLFLSPSLSQPSLTGVYKKSAIRTRNASKLIWRIINS